jgi:hypothetical protein
MSGASAKVRLTREDPIKRRELVAEGRRLVIFDLGQHGPDDQLAHLHQEMVLGKGLRCQWHTWFKTVAARAHNGWRADHAEKLSGAERDMRLQVARGLLARLMTGPQLRKKAE